MPNKYKGVYICYVDRAELGRCMLYTTDISINKINTKKKRTLLKKIIHTGPVEYNKKKLRFFKYESTIKLINL